MKFQKVLIALYLILQYMLFLSVKQISGSSQTYLTCTFITIVFFMLSHLKDPGYLLVADPSKVDGDYNGLEPNEQINQPGLVVENQSCAFPNGHVLAQHAQAANVIVDLRLLNTTIQIDGQVHKLIFSNFRQGAKKNNRFCGICMINQPFRTRHCHECQKCVSTYDHHCPWINNCVVSQTTQAFFAAVEVCQTAINRIITVQSQWIEGICLIIFFCGIVSLAGFHTYLMVNNVTTWQLAKWDTISYLCKYDRKQKSPFTKGVVRNIKEYWTWGMKKSRKIWEFETQ